MSDMTRRKWLRRGVIATAGVSGVLFAERLGERYGLIPPDSGGIFAPERMLTYSAQRLLTSGSMAREFSKEQISNPPFANGRPLKTPEFLRHQAEGFANWRLDVNGLVSHPLHLSLEELRGYDASSSINQLVCEEGWSYIAEWTGVRLSHLLKMAGIKPEARFVVYSSFEDGWWDSVDMADALHPQTLVSYTLNGKDLPIGNGGPLRLRVPRQLGYKSVKYLNRITVVDDIRKIGNGLGSPGPDYGYAWYSGI